MANRAGGGAPSALVTAAGVGECDVAACAGGVRAACHVVVEPTNLWRPVAAGTVRGIDFELEGDGAVRVAGTQDGTGPVSSVYAAASALEAGTYTLSCSGLAGGVSPKLKLDVDGAATRYVGATAEGRAFDAAEGTTCTCYVEVAKGAVVDATLRPMLEVGSTAHPYVPYDMT